MFKEQFVNEVAEAMNKAQGQTYNALIPVEDHGLLTSELERLRQTGFNIKLSYQPRRGWYISANKAGEKK